MTDIVEDFPIKNWSIFANVPVQIQLIEKQLDNDFTIYNAMLFFILSENQNITFEIKLEHTDKEKFIKLIFVYASTLFPSILAEVLVMDEAGVLLETLDLRKFNMVPDGHTLQ